MATSTEQLLDELRALLLQSESFDSTSALRSLFTGPLRPFRDSLPEAHSKRERVDTTVAYLLDKARGDTGENGLVLLIQALRGRVHPDDERHEHLGRIALHLEAALDPPPAGRARLAARRGPALPPQGLLWSGLGFAAVLAALAVAATPLRCVVEYRLTEVMVALLLALAGGAFVLVRNLLPGRLQAGAQGVYGGAAAGLLVGLIATVALPKISEDTCWSIVGAGQLAFAPAQPDELLLVVVPFAGGLSNVSAFPERYVFDALSSRVERLRKAGQTARLELWDAQAGSQREARVIGERSGATLVIWGQFDDVAGVRAFIEIMRDVPEADIQLGGNWLELGTLASAQSAVGATTRACLLDGLPAQAELLADVALGMIQLVRRQAADAEQSFTRAIGTTTPAADCGGEESAPFYWRGLTRGLREQYPAALDDLSRAIAIRADDPLALNERGAVQLALGRIEAAETDFQQALSLIEPGDHAARGALLGNLGLTRELQGDLAGALERYEEADSLAVEQGDQLARALSAGHLGSLAQRQGDLERAQELQARARDLCRALGHWRCEAVALGNLGLVAYRRGDADGALELFTQAQGINAAGGSAMGEGQQLLRVGVIQLDRRQTGAAREAYTRALALFEAAGSPAGQGRAQIGLALVADQEGDRETTLAALERALSLLDAVGSPDAAVVRQQIQRLRGG